MQPKDAKELLKKYREGTATDAEKDLLGDWVLFGKLKTLDLTDEELEQELALLDAGLPLYRTKVTRLWPRIAAAASILLVLSLGGYFILHKKQPVQQIAQNQFHDIAPGGNKATLTLSNGRQINLSDASNGTIASQGQTLINKTADGQVVYAKNGTPSSLEKAGEAVYNTMNTPRGGQFHLVLSDGTNVWLNAASSIKYPAAFKGNSRQVEITGEAYFEVAHNAAKPFRVISNGQTVEVLGTHFNISSYNDEPSIKTTLLEGSVKVSDENGGALLKPGDQAVLKNHTISVVKTDVDDAVAWKNGQTTFESADIYTVMRQVARWYNVNVTFAGDMPKRHFTGAVSRSANISEVLRILASSKLHFKIQDKNITVTP